ncbi:uncharacterized protein LOC122292736 [Carya illinoinensis]|uniref:uncharacterized protein LOC122292736 n=1 Tax=Carya illinoinensis TaxID=32201 RepID=UPI001C7219B9|nr:uncharacterized protein LOC122292736 [Carya illinoinensis]
MIVRNITLFYILAMVVEIFGGVKSNSLAVITNAAHLLSDVGGFSFNCMGFRFGGNITLQYSSRGLGYNHYHKHNHHASGHLVHEDHEREYATTEEKTNLASDSPEKNQDIKHKYPWSLPPCHD